MVYIVLLLSLLANAYFVINRLRYDGNIVVKNTELGGTVFSLELDMDPEEIREMKIIRFKVSESAE